MTIYPLAPRPSGRPVKDERPRLSPQDIDREINEQLDAEHRYHFTPALPIGARGGLPHSEETGRRWRIGVRRHGRMPMLEDIERRAA